MAFPVTPILDDFNRANDLTPPPGANWSNFIVSGDTSGMILSSNALTFGSAFLCSTYWNASSPGPDCEAYATTVFTPPTANGSFISVFARISNPNSASMSAYEFRFTRTTVSASSTWELYRWDNNVATLIASGATAAMVDGDKLGIECSGSQISGYRFTAGSWAQKATVVDTTYAGAGFIGLRLNDLASDGFELDDFGGGSSTPAIATNAYQ